MVLGEEKKDEGSKAKRESKSVRCVSTMVLEEKVKAEEGEE